MKFPRAQYEAIQKFKEEDRRVGLSDLPRYIDELQKKEKDLNDLFWDQWEHGKIVEPVLADYLVHQRNATRVRIMRLQKRMM